MKRRLFIKKISALVSIVPILPFSFGDKQESKEETNWKESPYTPGNEAIYFDANYRGGERNGAPDKPYTSFTDMNEKHKTIVLAKGVYSN